MRLPGAAARVIQSGAPAYLAIHYGDAGSPPRVLCGSQGASRPVSRDWAVVTCPACLNMGSERGAPSARARIEALAREAAEADD